MKVSGFPTHHIFSESSKRTPVEDDVISVSSTESSVSLQIVDETDLEPKEGEEKVEARSAFESLQNTVYSEVRDLF